MRTIKPLLILAAFVLISCGNPSGSSSARSDAPRIVNIINFIRQLEPRDREKITEEVLYQTVVEQVKQLKKHHLPGTFLLQYDALINPAYQELLKNELEPGSEIGAWWEITQPHVEAAGLQWRGRFPWDWHADVGFSVDIYALTGKSLVSAIYQLFLSGIQVNK
jgi:hypothetical protein